MDRVEISKARYDTIGIGDAFTRDRHAEFVFLDEPADVERVWSDFVILAGFWASRIKHARGLWLCQFFRLLPTTDQAWYAPIIAAATVRGGNVSQCGLGQGSDHPGQPQGLYRVPGYH